MSHGLKLAERFRVAYDGSPSARRQRVDPNVELEEARDRLCQAKIEETMRTIEKFYLLGQGFTEDDIIIVLNYLLKRDYPDVFNLTDHAYLLKRIICVPIEYIPRCPKIVEVDHHGQIKLRQSLNADNQLSHDKKLSLDTRKKYYSEYQIGMAMGDSVEKTVFKVLKDFFSGKDQNVVIIKGLEMKRINPERKQDSREMDLVVISHILGLIINIECQKQLKFKMAKLKEKIDANKNFFQDWFSADSSDKWKFVSLFYCEQHEYSQCCRCCQYLAKGETQLKQILERIVDRNKVPNLWSSFHYSVQLNSLCLLVFIFITN